MSERMKKAAVAAGWLLFLGMLLAAVYAVSESSAGSGDVQVICIQTQNDADSTLLVQNGAAVLIDAGESCDAGHILEVLAQYGVTRLDAFVLTHGDADHVGGAQEVLSRVPAACVVEPYYDAGSTVDALNDALAEAGVRIVYPTRTLRLRAGQMRVLIYPPLEKHYGDSNNYSLAALVQHGEVNMLFTGDALRKRCQELLQVDWPPVDLYKVPHHGRASSATEAMFQALSPRYAVVTSDQADSTVTAAAEAEGAQLFYTLQGECVFTSDGRRLTAASES